MKALRTLVVCLLILVIPLGSLAVEYPEGTLYRGIYGYTEEIEFLQYQLFFAGYLGMTSLKWTANSAKRRKRLSASSRRITALM